MQRVGQNGLHGGPPHGYTASGKEIKGDCARKSKQKGVGAGGSFVVCSRVQVTREFPDLRLSRHGAVSRIAWRCFGEPAHPDERTAAADAPACLSRLDSLRANGKNSKSGPYNRRSYANNHDYSALTSVFSVSPKQDLPTFADRRSDVSVVFEPPQPLGPVLGFCTACFGPRTPRVVLLVPFERPEFLEAHLAD